MPHITANLAVSVPATVIADIQTHWLTKNRTATATLAYDVAADDLTITVSSSPELFVVGTTLLIDDEPVSITAINGGGTYTVARYATAFPFIVATGVTPMTAHVAGTTVYSLRHSSPWRMLAEDALRPWVVQVVLGLGNESQTLGTSITGDLSLS